MAKVKKSAALVVPTTISKGGADPTPLLPPKPSSPQCRNVQLFWKVWVLVEVPLMLALLWVACFFYCFVYVTNETEIITNSYCMTLDYKFQITMTLVGGYILTSPMLFLLLCRRKQ